MEFVSSFNFISSLYWLFAFTYLYHHPPRYFGAEIEYPDYKIRHTLMKISPLILASYLDPTNIILIFADSLFDLEYLNPKLIIGLYTGCYSYQIYHLARIYQLYTKLNFGLDIFIILSAITTCLIFSSLLKIKSTTFRIYIFIISLRLYLSILYSWSEFILVAILGLGDCLLVYSKDNLVPYKDQITMMSTYIHVWGNLLLHY